MQGGTYSQAAWPTRKSPYTWNVACQSVGPGYSAATLMVRHNRSDARFSLVRMFLKWPIWTASKEQMDTGILFQNVKRAVQNSPNGVESSPKTP